jgi:SAM-dependent methyltransferase
MALVARRYRPWELPPLPGESESALHLRQDTAYFAEQIEESVDWWNRMGASIDLTGLRVLDFGCGHGALSLSAAQRGASAVVGVDIDARRIDFANAYIPAEYPQYADNLSFIAADVAELDEDGTFDALLSKDAFEHVEDLPATIGQMRRLLKPGGRLLVGFSPLFHSPFGDHGRLAPALPWLPALLPERLVLSMASRRHGTSLSSMSDVGLNKLTPSQFRASFPQHQWRIERILYNRSDRRLMPVLNAMRKVPGLERWFTVGIYAIVTRI